MIHATSFDLSVAEIARIVNGMVVGNHDKRIKGVQRIDSAGADDIAFINSEAYLKALPSSNAAAVLVSELVWKGAQAQVSEQHPHPAVTSEPTLIIVPDAYRAFIALVQQVFSDESVEPGQRHPSAVIHPTARIDETASIGPCCVVGEGVVIGAYVKLHANVSVYRNVNVGDHTVIFANAVVGSGTEIGSHCIIHPGAVIGADGFGFLENPDGSFTKVPQIGIVILGNDVEVGANTTIDRAALGATTIEDGVKLDNLVHIAHGVHIGEHTAIAAQAGISGSTKLGNRNRIAGQVGVVGHITTTDDVVVEAQSGLSKSIKVAGHYFGSPAKEHRTALRMEVAYRQLPELLRQVQLLQHQVQELKDKLHE